MAGKYRFLRLRLPFSMEKLVKRVMVLSFIFFLIWIIPNIGKILFAMLLIGLSILVGLYRRVLPFYLGIELITFTTVVTCYLVSPVVAWISCLIILSAQAIMTGHITIHYFIKVGTYTVVVLFCALAPGMDIALAGRIMTVFINIAYFASNIAMGDAQGLMDTPGNVVNIFINFWIFSKTSWILELIM